MTFLAGLLMTLGLGSLVFGVFALLIFGIPTLIIAGVVMMILGAIVGFIGAVAQSSREKRDYEEERRVQRMAEEKSRREHNAFMKHQAEFLADGRKITMDGHTFEEYCAYLLKKNGYTASVTRGSGDHGADIIAKKDGRSYAIQCKKYSRAVGNKAVQEALMGKHYYKTDYAVVMTDYGFTPQAIEDADAADVLLWDQGDLMEMARNAQR